MYENCEDTDMTIFRYSFYRAGEYRGERFTINKGLHDILAEHIRKEGTVLEGHWVVVCESANPKRSYCGIFDVTRKDKFTVTALT